MDPELAERFISEGKLPNLAMLQEQGTFRKLRTTYPPISPVAWSTFMTGVNPGKHGIFDFSRLRPGAYEIEFVNATFRKAPTIWKLLSDAGRSHIWQASEANGLYAFVLEGEAEISGTALERRDSMALEGEKSVEIAVGADGTDMLLVETKL